MTISDISIPFSPNTKGFNKTKCIKYFIYAVEGGLLNLDNQFGSNEIDKKHTLFNMSNHSKYQSFTEQQKKLAYNNFNQIVSALS